MIKFVIDEDMPRSTARALAERGFECLDIRDYGLRGKSDKEIRNYSIKINPLWRIYFYSLQEGV